MINKKALDECILLKCDNYLNFSLSHQQGPSGDDGRPGNQGSQVKQKSSLV